MKPRIASQDVNNQLSNQIAGPELDPRIACLDYELFRSWNLQISSQTVPFVILLRYSRFCLQSSRTLETMR